MCRVSIIIPTLNEENYIGQLLSQLNQVDRDMIEVIIIDGGSVDHTPGIVERHDYVNLILSKKGRAVQMNGGAKEAKGEYLLFLHADSVLPEELINDLVKIETESGSFKMKFTQKRFLYNFYSWFTSLNWTVFTYGDQGLWVKKSVFDKIGGFKEMPLLEDMEIVARLKKVSKFKKLPYSILTSSRRFASNGVIKQQLINILIVTAYYLGVSPHFLARYYRY